MFLLLKNKIEGELSVILKNIYIKTNLTLGESNIIYKISNEHLKMFLTFKHTRVGIRV